MQSPSGLGHGFVFRGDAQAAASKAEPFMICTGQSFLIMPAVQYHSKPVLAVGAAVELLFEL